MPCSLVVSGSPCDLGGALGEAVKQPVVRSFRGLPELFRETRALGQHGFVGWQFP